MRTPIESTLVWSLLASLLLTPSLAGAGDVVETIEVQRDKTKEPKHPTLRFLKDNRVFLRGRLDRLRTQTRRVREGEGKILDERLLRLQEMARAIAAARDTVGTRRDLAAQRELLRSVTQLGELEDELSLMEALLAEQRNRLLFLEQDFVGHQETALVILLTGRTSVSGAPNEITLSEEDETVRVALTPEQWGSLGRGGIAQVYHEFVEPREHRIEVGFAGGEWSSAGCVPVVFNAARDRLTFLELDVSRLDRASESLGLTTNVWYR
jgi:hypothetical protein